MKIETKKKKIFLDENDIKMISEYEESYIDVDANVQNCSYFKIYTPYYSFEICKENLDDKTIARLEMLESLLEMKHI